MYATEVKKMLLSLLCSVVEYATAEEVHLYT